MCWLATVDTFRLKIFPGGIKTTPTLNPFIVQPEWSHDCQFASTPTVVFPTIKVILAGSLRRIGRPVWGAVFVFRE